jgi:hypothetical protein
MGFVLDLIGVAGDLTIVGIDGHTLRYDSPGSELQRLLPGPQRVTCKLTRTAIRGLVFFQYTKCAWNQLPKLFDRQELARQFLLLSRVPYIVFPFLGGETFKQFMRKELHIEWMSFKRLVALFPHIYRFELHTELLTKIDLAEFVRSLPRDVHRKWPREAMSWLARSLVL